jgi:hypothetical protein
MKFKFKFPFFSAEPKAKEPVGVDQALARISVLDEVIGTKVNVDGTVTIYVKGSVAESYTKIVSLMKRHAPGTRGEVRRAQWNKVALPVNPVAAVAQQSSWVH